MAIGLVLLFHLTPGRDSNQGLRSTLAKVADLGWSGGDLFFVLSGFMITSILVRSLGKPHYFRDFYVPRTLRILPLYYAVLAITFWLLPIVGDRCVAPALRHQLRTGSTT